MWKNKNFPNFPTNPSFLLKFFDDAFQACLCLLSMFNTHEQFLYYNFIMNLDGNKLTRLNKLT